MQITTTSFTSGFLNQIDQLESQQSTLQNESTTGLKVSLPEDNPSVMDQVLNLQTESSANTQYQSNITQLQATATTTGRHDSAAGGTRLAAAGTPAAATAAGSAAASSSTGIGVSVHSTSAQAGRGRRAAHRYHAKTVAAAPPSPAA